MNPHNYLRAALTCGAIIALTLTESSAQEGTAFRTDINPALLYFQAYQNMPQLTESDSSHLFDHGSGGAWPDGPFDPRALGLLGQYDVSFKLLDRARSARVPCDWGYDLTDGPEALLPGLAPAKRLAQVARLRAMAGLDGGRFEQVLSDLAATLALARNLSTDRVLISALVQIAMENILTSIVMENYYRLSADQLDRIVAVFDAAPRRGTIAQTIPTEHASFYRYTRDRVEALRMESGGSDERFWAGFGVFWTRVATEFGSTAGPDPSVDRIKQAAGGTAAGVARLLEAMPPLYAETARVMALPYPEFRRQSPALWAQISGSDNPFVRHFFTLFVNVRGKEFSAMVRQEMVRAAAAFKRGGGAAIGAVKDPLVGEAFEWTRVSFEGVDRGFRLRSRESFRDFDEVMIFIETPGKHFRLDGKNAGTAQ